MSQEEHLLCTLCTFTVSFSFQCATGRRALALNRQLSVRLIYPLTFRTQDDFRERSIPVKAEWRQRDPLGKTWASPLTLPQLLHNSCSLWWCCWRCSGETFRCWTSSSSEFSGISTVAWNGQQSLSLVHRVSALSHVLHHFTRGWMFSFLCLLNSLSFLHTWQTCLLA